ncbi:MAG: 2-dehydropantoate 2-reductase N-terminal domain-containing protein [Oscillospiraceae bacterium]|nr:2-dehydropantoate 2-reductase N-terminal domain-containing protein [Oscillospiraceae bacterium]
MRILVYGAGVIGANLAADLFASGKDVTLLARGEWADTIEKNGLIIDPVFFPGRKKYRIPVIRELRERDFYDAIFLVLRYTQLDSVFPVLTANVSTNLVLIGNNLSTEKSAVKLAGKNVLFGFSMAAGHRERDRVVSVSLHRITVGQLKGNPSNEKLIRQIFSGTNMKVKYEPDMGDYLLCHAAFVIPVGFACYSCDGNLKRIKKNRAYLNQIIDANIEGYAAIEGAGHKILPASDRDYRSRKYRRLCYRVYKLMCATVIGKICASDHALNAVEEMSALNETLKAFFDAHRAAYPNYKKLERDAEKYLSKG